MKFISIKLKENYIDYLRILFLLLFSFFICYYFGFQGIIPLDDFVNLNSGYRVYHGDVPFKDYYEVFKLIPDQHHWLTVSTIGK